MLRRLDVKAPWRSLSTGFWASNFPLGKRTIAYGHNGSGKSTVAELLLSLADSRSATGVVWEDEKGDKTSVRAGGTSPSPHMAVYTRRWVDENLSAFLDGASAAAIVTLGKEAIDAKGEGERLVGEVDRLQFEAREAEKSQDAAEKKLKALTKEVQERIISELQTFDYSTSPEAATRSRRSRRTSAPTRGTFLTRAATPRLCSVLEKAHRPWSPRCPRRPRRLHQTWRFWPIFCPKAP